MRTGLNLGDIPFPFGIVHGMDIACRHGELHRQERRQGGDASLFNSAQKPHSLIRIHKES
jgi:hypothetical protein